MPWPPTVPSNRRRTLLGRAAAGPSGSPARVAALERETPAMPQKPGDLADWRGCGCSTPWSGGAKTPQRPISGDLSAVQGFVSKEMEGLGTWPTPTGCRTPACGRSRAKPALSEALVKWGMLALLVRNLAFCSEVLNYGCLKRFDKYEFTPGQEMLVYAEVENFASEPTPARLSYVGLRPSYQVLDSQGRWVSNHGWRRPTRRARASATIIF